jgi:GTP pyrophosphokinase
MAGLLHDTVEDTDLTFAQVEAMFGHTVRSIVEGETKVSKLPKLAFEDYADEQVSVVFYVALRKTGHFHVTHPCTHPLYYPI